jgi:hypothetical protein
VLAVFGWVDYDGVAVVAVAQVEKNADDPMATKRQQRPQLECPPERISGEIAPLLVSYLVSHLPEIQQQAGVSLCALVLRDFGFARRVTAPMGTTTNRLQYAIVPKALSMYQVRLRLLSDSFSALQD